MSDNRWNGVKRVYTKADVVCGNGRCIHARCNGSGLPTGLRESGRARRANLPAPHPNEQPPLTTTNPNRDVPPMFFFEQERLRGSIKIEHTLAKIGAERFWKTLHEEPYIPALGCLTGAQAVQAVQGGKRRPTSYPHAEWECREHRRRKGLGKTLPCRFPPLAGLSASPARCKRFRSDGRLQSYANLGKWRCFRQPTLAWHLVRATAPTDSRCRSLSATRCRRGYIIFYILCKADSSSQSIATPSGIWHADGIMAHRHAQAVKLRP
jgi:hypothetical protein